MKIHRMLHIGAGWLWAIAALVSFGADKDVPYTVAYTSFGPLDTSIYVVDGDGKNERVLVEGGYLDSNPSYSPDGKWVVFTSRRGGSADIYRVKADGSGLERLTDDPAFDDQAVLSPDGRYLAFVSSRSGQADIWVLDLQTRRLQNVTDHPGGDYRPAWSPDGAWIAFTSDRDSKGAHASTPGDRFTPPQLTKLYLVRADGTGVRRLTDGDGCAGGACWSPDGGRIICYEASDVNWFGMSAMARRGDAPTSQIVSVDVATGAREVLTTGPAKKIAPRWAGSGRIGYIWDESPRALEKVNLPNAGIRFTDGSPGLDGPYSNPGWSPDGRHMVFHREREAIWPPVTPTFSRDTQFRLVRTGVFPSYSPDGSKLMSNTGYAAIFENAIVVMNPDGSDRRIVYDDPVQNINAPVWSPTGDRIAFGLGRYNSGSKGPKPVASAVATVKPDGTGLQKVTPDNGMNYGFPSWSPEGKRLVLRGADPKWRGLLILDLETKVLTPLSPGKWNDNFPAWSPDGGRIVFTSDRDGDWEIYSVRVDGSDLTRLTNCPGNDAHSAWSSDGKWIAFSSARGGFKDEMPRAEGGGQGAGDIFVMRADGSDVRRLTDDAWEEATPAFAPR